MEPQKPIRAFVPPTRPKHKPQEDDEAIWKWLKVLGWLVAIALVINGLLWLLSRGF